MTDLVLVSRPADGVAVLTLNRPEARNALSVALRTEFVTALRSLASDESIAAVVVTGSGPVFSAGVDLKELGSGRSNVSDAPPDSYDMVAAIRACAAPVIAAVNGAAVTGGFEVVLACDIVLASSAARFADTHARVGIMPTWGISQRLPRLIGMNRAKEMSFTGNFIDAATAEQWGIVNHVYAPDDLVPRAIELATDIASADSRAVRGMKRLYDTGGDGTFADGLRTELAHTREHMSAVTPADIEARRQAVMARGRQQSS